MSKEVMSMRKAGWRRGECGLGYGKCEEEREGRIEKSGQAEANACRPLD